ncbi:hypothetical protein D3C81_2335350 [compost metagenome]
MQQGRFAGARWPQQQRVSAARQFKKWYGEYGHTAVAVLQLGDGQHIGLDQQWQQSRSGGVRLRTW